MDGVSVSRAVALRNWPLSRRCVVQQYLGYLPYLTGGPFFMTSGLLYLIQFSGNPFRGALEPISLL